MHVFDESENIKKVKIESLEDLWHLEKVISPGDQVTAFTHRKFISEGGRAEKKPIILKISVEKVEFNPNFQSLRILGKILEANPEEYAPKGAYHSIDVSINDRITIQKQVWKKHEISRLLEAQEESKKPKLSILVLDEREAELFQIFLSGIKSKGQVSTSGIKEGMGEKTEYFKDIYNLISKSEIDFLILAGPGFEKENFYKFLKEKNKQLAEKTLIESTGNTGAQGVYELVKKGTLEKLIRQNRFSQETKAIDSFIEQLSKDSSKVAYGFEQIKEAITCGAVDTLLVLDSLLFEKRENLEQILEEVEKKGAKVLFISHENEESKKLAAFGGIVAILRFSLNFS
ncbi:MAG: mRNA surveillance protein pelota [archaeon]